MLLPIRHHNMLYFSYTRTLALPGLIRRVSVTRGRWRVFVLSGVVSIRCDSSGLHCDMYLDSGAL